jgi:hypothetical protein
MKKILATFTLKHIEKQNPAVNKERAAIYPYIFQAVSLCYVLKSLRIRFNV